MIKREYLDLWFELKLNLLLIGKHGVGKTAIIKQFFDSHNLNWLYFSGATLDPWVDFIGIPKEATMDGVKYIEIIPPKALAFDKVDAIFIDELNRSRKEVRNAVMELIQFKSLNGKKLSRLKVVWAAINPEKDGEYDVEPMDGAMYDRFQIPWEVPYLPDRAYFVDRFGEDNANAAIAWWNELPEKIRAEVSPRRLDYALDFYEKGGPVEHILPAGSNPNKLVQQLKSSLNIEILRKMMEEKDEEGARKFLSNENNYRSVEPFIAENSNNISFFLPLLSSEKISTLISRQPKVLKICLLNLKPGTVCNVIKEIHIAGTNKNVCESIRSAMNRNPEIQKMFDNTYGEKSKSVFNKETNEDFEKEVITKIKEYLETSNPTTNDRMILYGYIENNIPKKINDKKVVKELCNFIEDFAKSSHKSTLERLNNFPGVVNNIIDNSNIFGNSKLLKNIIQELGKKSISIYNRMNYELVG